MADVPPANTAQNKRKFSALESSQTEQENGSRSSGIDDPARPHITRLAPELLREIFSYFQHPDLHENKMSVEDIYTPLPPPHFDALKNSRLTCSVFNRVATPLLLPILRIRTDRKSLDRVEAIAQNPLLCSGVRGIQILMSCRLRSFAFDSSEYLSFIQQRVSGMLDRQSTDLALRVAQGENEGHQLALDHRAAHESPTYDRTRACLMACGLILGSAPLPPIMSVPSLRGVGFREAIVGLVPPALISEYYTMLNQAYITYQVDYKRDFPVVSEGLLVKALAQVVSTPARTVSLSFSESLSDIIENEETEAILVDPRFTMTWLLRTTKPSECRKYSQYLEREDVAPYTAMFSDLPIAIHQKGSSVNSLELHGPLIDYQASILCPGGGSSISHRLVLNQLQMALQNLHTFILPDLEALLRTARQTPSGRGHMAGRDPGGISIAQYLNAVLSSRRLQKLELNISLSDEDAVFHESRLFEIGQTLSQISYRHLRIIRLRNIKITQQDLQAFCTLLSPEVEYLEFAIITLTDEGRWIPILDLLRDLLRERCAQELCQVELERLHGGEMDQVLDNFRGDAGAQESFFYDLMDQICCYVAGEGVHTNPLHDFGPF
ncbi:unnamed protein product [Clonostachys rhizophaga]|uniref:Uncharacterized protein n=1 Tax=Clonostachys rhizophaga TaxID=160324 RepID=A0A9N9YF64_9HYPO|nr:unnamed protein product [Clonostachys rhizophaga]